jgi:AcrR family transcriptional regulator
MKHADSTLPYQRIAASLQQRIVSGELRPGERVPSTRALAREWGVALATAAHALKLLADGGFVRGESRVGTVVASVPARAATTRGRDSELTRDRIVEAAIALADAEGLPALSLRGVAARLDAPVMSLYRHVGSKDELLRHMTDAVLGQAKLPSSPPPGWRAQLEVAARVQWAGLRRHPWLPRVLSITRPELLPNAIAHAEWVLRALDGHGLDAALRMRMHVILHGFLQGIAGNLEAEAEAASRTGMTDDEWMAGQADQLAALVRSGRYPVFASVVQELQGGFDLDFEALFEIGLSALLDGFARVIERGRAPRRG